MMNLFGTTKKNATNRINSLIALNIQARSVAHAAEKNGREFMKRRSNLLMPIHQLGLVMIDLPEAWHCPC